MFLIGLNGGIREGYIYLRYLNVVFYLFLQLIWQKLVIFNGLKRDCIIMVIEEDVVELIMFVKKFELYGYGSYKGGQY